MNRNVDIIIKNLDGTPVNEDKTTRPGYIPVAASADTPPVPLTIKSVACDALLMARDGDKQLDSQTSLKRLLLAQRLFAGGIQEINNSELDLIQRLVGVMFPPLISGQVSLWCDTDGEKPAAVPAKRK